MYHHDDRSVINERKSERDGGRMEAVVDVVDIIYIYRDWCAYGASVIMMRERKREG